MNATVSIEQVRERVKALPALPRAVHDLRTALRQEDVASARVVAAVSSDQALTAAALRLANSSFYGLSRRIVSLDEAVHILGLRTLSRAVMTAAVMSSFERGRCPGFDFDGNWRHALATAMCAEMLAQPRGVDADAAYTAGLLHDIGRLALASCFPDEFAQALAHGVMHDLTPMEAERAVMGIDHAAVGGIVATHWRFAPCIVRSIQQHHEVRQDGEDDSLGLLDVLHLADHITHALDLSHEADDMVPALSHDAWDRAAPSSEELLQLFGQIETRMAAVGCGLAA